MKVLIYSLNYSPELTGIGKYNGEMAESLVSKGHEVSVLTAPAYYPEWKRHKGYRNWWSKNIEKGVRVLRCPLYVPGRLNLFTRLVHLLSFSLSSALRLLFMLREKHQVIFILQPTLFCVPMALLYAKLTGAKTILHIQDFEVDAMLGLELSKSGLVSRLANRFESAAMKGCDRVSTISISMMDKARAKGVAEEKLMFFPNWAETDKVATGIDGSHIRQKWGLEQTDKLVLYSGNIGHKQGLEIVLSAAKHFVQRTEVKFVIVGNGGYKKTLEKMARKMRLSNVMFLPLQPWEDVPAILNTTDVHLVIQKKGAADAVLPSKLTNILSAGGHAIVTAEKSTELGKLEATYPGIFWRVEPESTELLIAGIEALLEQDTRESNQQARQYALDNLDRNNIIRRFDLALTQIT